MTSGDFCKMVLLKMQNEIILLWISGTTGVREEEAKTREAEATNKKGGGGGEAPDPYCLETHRTDNPLYLLG